MSFYQVSNLNPIPQGRSSIANPKPVYNAEDRLIGYGPEESPASQPPVSEGVSDRTDAPSQRIPIYDTEDRLIGYRERASEAEAVVESPLPESPERSSDRFILQGGLGVYGARGGGVREFGVAGHFRALYRYTLKEGPLGHGLLAGGALELHDARSAFSPRFRVSPFLGYHAQGIYRRNRFRLDALTGIEVGLNQLSLGLNGSLAFLFRAHRSELGLSLDWRGKIAQGRGDLAAPGWENFFGVSALFFLPAIESRGNIPSSGVE